MTLLTDISPEKLRDRHRLSSQQINALFGRVVLEESYDEKATALKKVAEFLRVTDALAAAGIRFIPLKGPLLSYRLYGDATTRFSSDLDILTEPAAVRRAGDIFEEEGYTPYGRSWPGEIKEQQRLQKYSHHISYVKNEKHITIELHWRLMNNQCLNLRESEEIISQNLSALNFAGRSFAVLNNEMELLYLVIHGGLHKWGRLKWLADINEYLKSQPINWELFSRLSSKFKAEHMVALCNTILAEYFPLAPSLPGHGKAPRYMVRFSRMKIREEVYKYPDSVKTIIQNLRFSLNTYPGLIYRVRLIWKVMANSIFSGRISRFFR